MDAPRWQLEENDHGARAMVRVKESHSRAVDLWSENEEDAWTGGGGHHGRRLERHHADALGRQAGVELLEGAPYPDHHAFTQYDVSFLMKLAADHDARLVTTDKDHVRLPADMKDKVARASVKAAFEDEEALARLLDGVVR